MTSGKRDLFFRCFQDIDIEDVILALQHRDIPRIRQATQKVPGLEEICDHTALLDVEPVLTTTDRDALNTTQVQAHVPALFFSAIYKNVFAIRHGCHAYL